MNELTKLAKKYLSDKGNRKHNYTDIYQKYFEPIKNDKIRLLEMGVDYGASIRMWLDFFPNAQIVGVDIYKTPFTTDRYNHIQGDQANEDTIKYITADRGLTYDIIIDDCSHKYDDIRFCLNELFPSVRSGGLYIIEDIDCRRSLPMVEKLTTFAKYKIYDDEYIFRNTVSCEIYKRKIAFIRKLKCS